MRYRWKSLLVNLSLLLGSLALSLIFCEAILRLVAQNDSPLSMDIYQLDPYDQVSLKPNVTRRHFTREWNVTVAINSEGLRDRPSPVPDTRGRILAPGDSLQVALHRLPYEQVVSGTLQMTLLEGRDLEYALFAMHDPAEPVGFDLLSDLSEFFTAFSGMIDGFQERAHRVNSLLGDQKTCFIVVCGPQGEVIEEAVFFHSKLVEQKMNFAGVVVNRVRYRLSAGVRNGNGLEKKLGTELDDRKLAEKMVHNLEEYDALALRDVKNVNRLTDNLNGEPVIRVPYLDTDVHDIGGLSEICSYLFTSEKERKVLATE